MNKKLHTLRIILPQFRSIPENKKDGILLTLKEMRGS